MLAWQVSFVKTSEDKRQLSLSVRSSEGTKEDLSVRSSVLRDVGGEPFL